MNERKYLKWYNKVGYGSGDVAGNVVYAFLSSFVMIYLTDTIGLNAGIVGTLMMVSKLFDGFTDIFFGSLIDKTKTKMGKARPWMLWAFFGCFATLIAIFAIPVSLGETAKYAWFFIAYTLLNAVFFTANNIAYSALTSLITRNSGERVQMGSIRFMFAFGTSMLIQYITVNAVQAFGGGASGWRTVAILYAVIGVIVNTISVMSVKELPEEENNANGEMISLEKGAKESEKYRLKDAICLLAANKFYLIICSIYILTQIFTATLNMGVYFMTYILGDATLLGVFSLAINIPLIAGLIFTPILVKKAERHVLAQSRGIYSSCRRPWNGDRGGIYGKPASHAPLLGYRLHRHEPSAGRPERTDRLLLGIHFPHKAQTDRRHDVFLYLSGGKDRRRHRHRAGGLAAGRQRLHRQSPRTGPVLYQYAVFYVPVGSHDH